MPSIQDGTGNGYSAKVNKINQLAVFGTADTYQRSATAKGLAFNINSGIINISGTSPSAVLYFKNNEPPIDQFSEYAITALAVGIGVRSGTVSNFAEVKVIKNPTAGTIISGASNAPMKSNSNFGSSFVLDQATLIYKGADGNTFTDGDDHALFYAGEGRTYGVLDIDVPKGSSLGVTIDLNTTGSADIYVALIGHRIDSVLL